MSAGNIVSCSLAASADVARGRSKSIGSTNVEMRERVLVQLSCDVEFFSCLKRADCTARARIHLSRRIAGCEARQIQFRWAARMIAGVIPTCFVMG
jgi:hypothetical protein